LVMGSDLPAVDATCCRIMGIDPAKVDYLSMASENLGNVEESRIEQRGEKIHEVRTDFALIDSFRKLRLTKPGLRWLYAHCCLCCASSSRFRVQHHSPKKNGPWARGPCLRKSTAIGWI